MLKYYKWKIDYCHHYRTDENKEKEAGNGPFLKRCLQMHEWSALNSTWKLDSKLLAQLDGKIREKSFFVKYVYWSNHKSTFTQKYCTHFITNIFNKKMKWLGQSIWVTLLCLQMKAFCPTSIDLELFYHYILSIVNLI